MQFFRQIRAKFQPSCCFKRGLRAIANGGEIARPAAPDRNARQGAGKIRQAAQNAAHVGAQIHVQQQGFNRIKAFADQGGIGQGCGEMSCGSSRPAR